MKFAPTAPRILAFGLSVMMSVIAQRAGAAERPLPGSASDTALVDAMAVAAGRPDLSVVRVSGQSMLPYFGGEAVLVLKKIDAAKLRTGMIVVYLNRFGEKVAHRVIAPVAGGWLVKGYNNDRPDSTLVNGENLLGVVYATFHSTGGAAVELAAAGRPAVETVFAAPAK